VWLLFSPAKIDEKLRPPRRTPATSDINFKFLPTAYHPAPIRTTSCSNGCVRLYAALGREGEGSVTEEDTDPREIAIAIT